MNFPKLETESWRDWFGLRSYSTSMVRKDQIRAMTQHREKLRRSALELSVIRRRGRGQTRDEQHWWRREKRSQEVSFLH